MGTALPVEIFTIEFLKKKNFNFLAHVNGFPQLISEDGLGYWIMDYELWIII